MLTSDFGGQLVEGLANRTAAQRDQGTFLLERTNLEKQLLEVKNETGGKKEALEMMSDDGSGKIEMSTSNYQARARSARARRACALRALGLLLADGTPTVGGGKTF